MRARATVLSFAALAAALLLTGAADRYVDAIGPAASTSPDLVLRHLPSLQVAWLYWWGALAFVAFACAAAFLRERGRWGYLARSAALVIAARAVLMCLTPLRIPDGAVSVDSGLIYSTVGRHLTTHNDLFFSMHTAMPFLGSLVFRDRAVRAACLAFAFLMGATVLLLKTHYSLDVAGAFLVPYALHRFQGRWLEPALRRA